VHRIEISKWDNQRSAMEGDCGPAASQIFRRKAKNAFKNVVRIIAGKDTILRLFLFVVIAAPWQLIRPYRGYDHRDMIRPGCGIKSISCSIHCSSACQFI
jgi:hypothetical protein